MKKKKETKLQELERRISILENNKRLDLQTVNIKENAHTTQMMRTHGYVCSNCACVIYSFPHQCLYNPVI
jgi:hypothetical protein